ncbi:MAG: hypothetical protein EXR98_05105 [Gemmataceae bacterium]|nr:hypothetical protein [Gemmataceae bacterium]
MRRCLLLLLVLALGVSPAVAQPKKLLDTKGWGKLTGRVTFDGDLPAVVDLVPDMAKHPNKTTCLAAPAEQKVKQDWVIDKKTRGVANVFVWIKPPQGTYFPILDADKTRKDTVTIDHPFCTFVPHAAAAFPHYFDGAKYVRTGQKFVLKNSAPLVHCVLGNTNPLRNESFNLVIKPGAHSERALNAQPLPITLGSPSTPG